jgi:hypothetical protein
MSASCISYDRVPRNATHLFGNPAVPISGSVALRHQIALALPLSEIIDRYQQRSIFSRTKFKADYVPIFVGHRIK